MAVFNNIYINAPYRETQIKFTILRVERRASRINSHNLPQYES